MNVTPIVHRVEDELPPVGMKLVLLSNHSHPEFEVEAVEVAPGSKKFISGLEWKLPTGFLCPISKNDMWSYHKSLTAVIKLENELAEAVRDIMEYKSIATYLADCEAATACDVGSKKSSPKSEKARHANICRSVVAMLESGYLVGCKNINQRYTSKEGIEKVVQRCQESANLCEGKSV